MQYIAFAIRADGDFAVEIALGFQHGGGLCWGIFGQKGGLLAIQFFFFLLGNQRQMGFHQGFEVFIVAFYPHRIAQHRRGFGFKQAEKTAAFGFFGVIGGRIGCHGLRFGGRGGECGHQ